MGPKEPPSLLPTAFFSHVKIKMPRDIHTHAQKLLNGMETIHTIERSARLVHFQMVDGVFLIGHCIAMNAHLRQRARETWVGWLESASFIPPHQGQREGGRRMFQITVVLICVCVPSYICTANSAYYKCTPDHFSWETCFKGRNLKSQPRINWLVWYRTPK